MLRSNESVTPPERFVSDYLTHKPSFTSSVYDNFAEGLATVPNAINSFDEVYNKSPEGKAAVATREALERGNQNHEVGWVQWGANEAANMVGQALNPLTWVLGEGAGMLAKPLIAGVSKVAPEAASALMRKPIAHIMAEPASKYIPELVGKAGEEKTLSMALLGEEWVKGGFVGAGAMLPQTVLDNFNAETGKHDILGIAKGLGVGGVLGIGISTIPFAWGVAKANFNRARGKLPSAPIESGEADIALANGDISKETYDFLKDLETHLKNPDSRAENKEKLQAKSSQYVASQGHAVDHATDTASFEILNREQIANLQSATVDQLVADHIPEDQRTALTDFTVQAGIDDMRANPNMLDGVRGYVEYADKNLANREMLLTKADELVDQHLNTEISDTAAFSQSSLIDMVKAHAKNEVPFNVPRDISKRISEETKISNLEKKGKTLFERYEQTGNNELVAQMRGINEQIESLRAEMTPLKSPIEELKDIKDNLFKDGRLRNDFNIKPEYRRLQDLAEVWHPAKTLMDRINLENDIKQQEAYRDLAKKMLDIADQNVSKQAKVDSAKSYMQARTQQVVVENHKPKISMPEVESRNKLPADHEAMIAEQDRVVEKQSGKLTNDEYSAAKEKFGEFKKSEGIFKSLINCVLGAKNA